MTDVKEGDRVAFYFDDDDEKCWYKGVVTDLNRRKKRVENMTAKFDVDNQSSSIIATVRNYGASKCWVLIPADVIEEPVVVESESESESELED